VTAVIEVVLAAVFGLGSALVPVLNAEAFAVVTSAGAQPAAVVGVVGALALGQTVGKLLLFESARRNAGRLHAWLTRRHTPGPRASRWTERVNARLASRRTGLPLVFVSSSVGLPPLAVVSLAAGAAGQDRWQFASVCLVGRLVRFAAIAGPAALAVG
jgi:membrane protein YqaA with SNARE-associated domain